MSDEKYILDVTLEELKTLRRNAVIAYAVEKAFKEDVFKTLAITGDSFSSLEDLLDWADAHI